MNTRVSTGSGSCLPEWWFAAYGFVFLMFVAVYGALLVSDIDPLVAVWIPLALSAAAISAIHRVAVVVFAADMRATFRPAEPR
ncbi:hypothetical protein IU510_29620 [Nocardia cyriacigeorgica]|uniref:hypothetical protein n=1 Tax=Nocardia cyriacigeorgica TaxID=135487 RepID=UPI0018936EF3|nr:hypothetical protein [Nocardia cyriacigeorgica]MBF6102179.1 hypothetical protein [Nocardia cyriacigeorgica]MBF6347327.1 hypothetical protein [Nocardia cyriacigeorgica]